MDRPRMYSLYVLKLEGEKYYIGVTSKTPEERFIEHKNGFYGAEWTKLHKPLKIEQSKDLGLTTYEKAEAYENKVTREYVKKYGLDNVRGGNLSYRGRMVKRVGYVWRIDDWQDIVTMSLALLYILVTIVYFIFDMIVYHHGFKF